jgi:two-component system, chemotaxis family, sensor kinase CheA
VRDDGPDFHEIFRDEANDRLDRFVRTLLEIEGGNASADAVNSLFQDIHTIKGAAGMIGLEDVQGFAHRLEDRLEELREGKKLPAELVEPLLTAADSLRLMVEGEDVDTAEVEETIAEFAPEPTPKPEPEPAAEAPAPASRPARDTSVRVSAEKLDRLVDIVGETVLHRRRLEHNIQETGVQDDRLADELGNGGRLLDDLKDAAVLLRTLTVATVTAPLPRRVRDLAAEHGKQVDLVVSGGEVELDRLILDKLGDLLSHLVANAIAHGIEPPHERAAAGKPPHGTIEVTAEKRGGLVSVTVADDGRGVAPEVLAEAHVTGSLVDVLARPGYSTAQSVTQLSGRGMGVAAVKAEAEALGGTFEMQSVPGHRTECTLYLPLTLALLEVLLVERGGQRYALPLSAVDEVVTANGLQSLGGQQSLELHGAIVPVADLASVLGATAAPLPVDPPGVVVSTGGRRLAVLCDRLHGEEEVVIKPLGVMLERLEGYLGASILGDGRIALVLDPGTFTPAMAPAVGPADRENGDAGHEAPKVLVVEDSLMIRELQRSILEAAGYRVATAGDGRAGLDAIEEDDGIDLVVTDVEMPEMNGFALIEAIRAHPERKSLPVIVVTTLESEEDRRRGVEAGADAYMVKPAFDQQSLLDAVERFVGR